MVSGNPCCPRVEPVANRNLSISFVYSYEQRSSFQNKPPTVFETWFDLVEVSQLPYIILVALVLHQDFSATSGQGEAAVCKYISSV